jgi:3' terminal RNA ribose 2'-O-methyltransferase Hen1
MYLAITTTHHPATDLGFLLHKHPERVHRAALAQGEATAFCREATAARCTAVLSVEVDPVALVRGDGATIDQYVNDRPYAASSLLSTAIAQVYGTALSGRSKERPELAATPIPLTAEVVGLAGAAAYAERLFAPLGWTVRVDTAPLDERFPEWGTATHARLTLTGTARLADLLNHLYVLLPVIDGDKHFWVGEQEVAVLLRHGAGWLEHHPERAWITNRALKHQRSLTRAALQRLAELAPEADAEEEARDAEEQAVERPLSLNQRRLDAVRGVLTDAGARSVLDLGCGEGRLLGALLGERQFQRLVGVDVAPRCLEVATDRLRLDRMPPLQRQRIELLHGSLTYRDRRLAGFDAAACIEVIEHLDPHRLEAFTRNLFHHIAAPLIVVTTPNREHNVRFTGLPAGTLRHRDHRFEWTRAEFRAWAEAAAGTAWTVAYLPVGDDDPEVGPPTQMAVFRRGAEVEPAATH